MTDREDGERTFDRVGRLIREGKILIAHRVWKLDPPASHFAPFGKVFAKLRDTTTSENGE